jgi:hypothetical protein
MRGKKLDPGKAHEKFAKQTRYVERNHRAEFFGDANFRVRKPILAAATR